MSQGTEVMILGNVRSRALPAGAGYPGTGGPIPSPYAYDGPGPDWRANFITTAPVSPVASDNLMRVWNGGVSPGRARFGTGASSGSPIPGMRTLNGVRNALGALGADVATTVSAEAGGTGVSAGVELNMWRGRAALLHVVGAALGGYHGYHRNNKSTGWMLAWGVAGFVFPVITSGVALFQGVGKR